MIPEQYRAFLEQNRLAIVGVERPEGAPHLTPVYYVLDGDDLLVSTTASRYKAKAARRGRRVALCVIGEQPPFPYVTVTGPATVEEEGAVEAMLRIGERMTGNPIPESARPAVEQRAKDEGRVVLRVRPESFQSNVR
jgi:PPOX class probable F420-dependent enzyme